MNLSYRLALFAAAAMLPACAGAPKNPSPAAPPAAAVAEKPEPVKVEKPKASDLLHCVQGEDQRTVAIEKKESGCEVRYSKFGNSEVVAYAHHTPEFCSDVKAKIRTNLEAGSFTCSNDKLSPKAAAPAKAKPAAVADSHK
ncbi:MAG: hypothetical protein JST04_13655 [Bdellovibrionales bacterium]|nr:hypothetical protein [Bdellovibrionales bacterium]